MGASYLVIDSGSTFSYAHQAYEKSNKLKTFSTKKVILKSVNNKAHTNSDLYIYILSGKIFFVDL